MPMFAEKVRENPRSVVAPAERASELASRLEWMVMERRKRGGGWGEPTFPFILYGSLLSGDIISAEHFWHGFIKKKKSFKKIKTLLTQLFHFWHFRLQAGSRVCVCSEVGGHYSPPHVEE